MSKITERSVYPSYIPSLRLVLLAIIYMILALLIVTSLLNIFINPNIYLATISIILLVTLMLLAKQLGKEIK